MSTSTVIGVTARELMNAVASHVDRYPGWLKPVALACSTVLACCLILCATPFLFLFLAFGGGRKHQEGMRRVKLDLRRLWLEESSDRAVNHLRQIIETLQGSTDASVVVKPYGRLWTGPALSELWLLLYEYEVARKDWSGGLGVAEEMIDLLAHRDAAYWQRAKARCLIGLGRTGEAKEFLFSIRDPEHPDSEIEELLSGLRQAAR